MSNNILALSDYILTVRPPATRIAYHAGRYFYADEFYAAINYWIKQLQAQPFQRYALYTEDAYPFAVLLFALFHAGKQAWIPGNNRPGTAQQLLHLNCQLLGDWDVNKLFDYHLSAVDDSTVSLSPLNLEETRLVIFTSGSTGQPKPIEKRLIQFQLEIAVLEKQWGQQLGYAEVLATVSHQHIYGLLFRVLWPLSAGRCFHSPIYINPETLIHNIKDTACWVASPAQLKRLDEQSPWDGIAELTMVFCSGGALHGNARQQIKAHSGQQVIEVYGSSETGGIGWRQHDTAWQLFDGMRLSCFRDGRWWLYSPYLATTENEAFQLDDQLNVQDDGRFILHGRLDRIVKIEEKRLSLSELEQRLTDTPWFAEAFTLTIAKNRDWVGAALVLTEAGLEQLKTVGRNALIKRMRATLYQWFEPIVLPRKWLFLDTMPLTVQGKIDQDLLKALLETDTQKLPQVQHVWLKPDSVELAIKVPKDLIYFLDHFAGYPILPGVVQIAWAEHFGKRLFSINQPFSQMEAVKFMKTIQPDDELKLVLSWVPPSGKLYFNFSSDLGVFSSGRMIYEARL